MLTADLVLARRQKGELRLRALTSDDVARATVIADALVREARARVGETRESLAAAWQDIVDETLDRRLVLGLQKLVLDACSFSQRAVVDAVAYRRELFTAAAAARRELPDGVTIDREAVVREVATRLGIAENALETGLFSDLRDADTLERAPSIDGATFVAEHPRAQAQAALLRATHAVCTVASRDAAAVRAFFRTLKFHKLLFEVEATGEGAFVVRVDGRSASSSRSRNTALGSLYAPAGSRASRSLRGRRGRGLGQGAAAARPQATLSCHLGHMSLS